MAVKTIHVFGFFLSSYSVATMVEMVLAVVVVTAALLSFGFYLSLAAVVDLVEKTVVAAANNFYVLRCIR